MAITPNTGSFPDENNWDGWGATATTPEARRRAERLFAVPTTIGGWIIEIDGKLTDGAIEVGPDGEVRDIWMTTNAKELDALRSDRDHWKANHDHQVQVKRTVQTMYEELRHAYKEATGQEAPPPSTRQPEDGRGNVSHSAARENRTGSLEEAGEPTASEGAES